MKGDTCPHCGADLQSDPIPEKYLKHLYESDPSWDRSIHKSHEEQIAKWGRCYCFPYGESNTHFSRLIGVEIPGVYDGVLFWACPDCNGVWHRWDMLDMRRRAEPHMKRWAANTLQ